jgi:hypothetical protein
MLARPAGLRGAVSGAGDTAQAKPGASIRSCEAPSSRPDRRKRSSPSRLECPVAMEPKILGNITDQEIISSGVLLRVRERLRKLYGQGRWRKLKGVARVELPDGCVMLAEVHWYEAHGVGRREVKIKRLLEPPSE